MAAAVGRAVGEFHAEARDPGDEAPPSLWLRNGVDFDRPGPTHLRLLSGGGLKLLEALQRSDALLSRLSALAPPAGDQLVHGDLRWENVLVAPGPAPQVWLVDWEMGGAGEHAWDAGCVAAAAVSAWLQSLPNVPGVPPDRLGAEAAIPMEALTPGAGPVLVGVPRRRPGQRVRRVGRAVRAARRGAPRASGLRVHRARSGPATVGGRPSAGRVERPRRPGPGGARAPGARMTATAAVHPASAVATALAALEVRSPTTHSWMGGITELPEPVIRVADLEAGVRSALVGSICSTLYDSFYTHGRAAAGAAGWRPRPSASAGPSRTSSPQRTRAPAAWSPGGASSARRTADGSSGGAICGSGSAPTRSRPGARDRRRRLAPAAGRPAGVLARLLHRPRRSRLPGRRSPGPRSLLSRPASGGRGPVRAGGHAPAESRGARIPREGRRRPGRLRPSRRGGAHLRATGSPPRVRRRGGAPRGACVVPGRRRARR